MQRPITVLADRFKAMKIKEQDIGVTVAASGDKIDNSYNFWNHP